MQTMNKTFALPFLIVLTLGSAQPAFADEQTDAKPGCKPEDKKVSAESRKIILDAMQAELDRSRKDLKLDDFETPYFIAYQMRQTRAVRVTGKFGALMGEESDNSRNLYVEVRVGDYKFDNTADTGRDSFSFSFDGYNVGSSAPKDDAVLAFRNILWLMTDTTYKRALAEFHKKRGETIYGVKEKDAPPAFSQEKPASYDGPNVPFNPETARWRELVRKLSERFKSHPAIFDSTVRISADHVTRWMINSEGTKIIDEATYYGVVISAATRAEDGMLLDNDKVFYARTIEQFPSDATLEKAVDTVAENLEALRMAPVVDPFTGPAILAAEATGVLFHEALGHRLEGHRQDDEKEGRTFKDQVGREIIPPFISFVDDPTRPTFNGKELNGWYRYDDEGVPAQKAPLIENGVLKTYLLSRKPVKGFLQSNGHGRAAGGMEPVSRMGSSFVSADKSVSWATLKQRLIDLARAQKKPYGLIIKDITGGDTNTSSYGYQAFRGRPRMVYRVFADDGREELVRGLEMVGTPLTSINKIVAAGDTPEIFNGYCGAESGFVPVSAIAPPVLLEEIEVQRTGREAEKSPIMPSPWTGPVPKK